MAAEDCEDMDLGEGMHLIKFRKAEQIKVQNNNNNKNVHILMYLKNA